MTDPVGQVHPYEVVVDCFGEEVEIDVDLVGICKALWARDIFSVWSCQGDGDGNATLGFPDMHEADAFAWLVHRGNFPHNIVTEWGWRLSPRFPLDQSVTNVDIPRSHLTDLATALEAAPDQVGDW